MSNILFTPLQVDTAQSYYFVTNFWPIGVIIPIGHQWSSLVPRPHPQGGKRVWSRVYNREEGFGFGFGFGEFGHNPWSRERNLSAPMRLQL